MVVPVLVVVAVVVAAVAILTGWGGGGGVVLAQVALSVTIARLLESGWSVRAQSTGLKAGGEVEDFKNAFVTLALPLWVLWEAECALQSMFSA